MRQKKASHGRAALGHQGNGAGRLCVWGGGRESRQVLGFFGKSRNRGQGCTRLQDHRPQGSRTGPSRVGGGLGGWAEAAGFWLTSV